ncbi:MAG: hypothetical protein C4560_05530 [Nitrospiraceae bacterium]|nr:MAG: hypothetical protein C4560_05530 [Nitrospiraceae bacterium]
MKFIVISIGIAFLLLSGGCADRSVKPATKCHPKYAIDTVVIAPFTTDTVLVEEDRYRQMPQDIAISIPDRLKDQLSDRQIFKKVILSPECVENALKVEGKLISLIHSMRTFHLGARWQLINCANNERLYSSDNIDYADYISIKLTDQVVNDIVGNTMGQLNILKSQEICE